MKKTDEKTIDMVRRKGQEQFLKSGNRFSDKNCGKNKEIEQVIEPSEAKNVLGRRRKKEQVVLDAAILKAAQEAGKKYGDEGLVSYLEAQAHAAPSPFLTLLGKILAREDEQKAPPITRIELVAPQLDRDNEKELEPQE